MGHAHIRVIADGGQSIEHLPITADQHRIAHRGGIDRQIAENSVMPFNPRLIEFKTPMALAFRTQRRALRLRKRQCRAVIHRGLAHIQLLFTLEIQFNRRFKTFVKKSLVTQLIGHFCIAVKPGGLMLDAIPMQAQPVQIALYRLDIFGLGALGIRVIDPQNKLSARLTRDKIVKQRRAQVADVKIARRRRGKTCGCHRVLLLRSLYT